MNKTLKALIEVKKFEASIMQEQIWLLKQKITIAKEEKELLKKMNHLQAIAEVDNQLQVPAPKTQSPGLNPPSVTSEGATSEQKMVRTEDSIGNEHTPVATAIKSTSGMSTYLLEEELVDCTNQTPFVGEEKLVQPLASGSGAPLTADDIFEDTWDSDYYYEEQDSFS